MDPNAYARQDTDYSRMYALNAQVMDKEQLQEQHVFAKYQIIYLICQLSNARFAHPISETQKMIQNAFVTQDLSKMVKNVSQYASLINNTIQKQIDANVSMDLFNLAQYVWRDVDLINNGLAQNVFVNRNM